MFGRLSRASSSKTTNSTDDLASTTNATSPSVKARSSLESVEPIDDLEDGQAVSSDQLGVQEAAEKGSEVTDQGKVRTLLGVLKRCLSVKDLSSVRISLPASLMEPIGNLEYWSYADRPDFLCAVTESDDELERMLAVVRWTFTKDLKFVKAKIAKPYNSVLGEHFHAYWDTEPLRLNDTKEPEPQVYIDTSPSADVLANAGRKPAKDAKKDSSDDQDEDLPDLSQTSASADPGGAAAGKTSTRVVFLNEQTSHHPPISHFMIEARGPLGRVQCYGSDQLSAKFTGTNVKVFPGPHNKGIFISLPDRDNEEYQITHPTAVVSGLLRGNLYATVSETTFINVRSTTAAKRYRTILAYTEEGVIYEVKSESDMEWTKIKHVKSEQVIATLSGCWRGEVKIKFKDSGVERVLIDMVPLAVQPKVVAPLSEQDELETRRVWEPVSKALLDKDFGLASKNKQTLEQKQRDQAAERKKNNEVSVCRDAERSLRVLTGISFLLDNSYKPRFFESEPDQVEEWDGRPRLTQQGKEAIEDLFKADWTQGPESSLANP
ncbi:hypothetical protein OIV83_004969 [Microbotryomycetes sp. JL201]|nr:hypothetical protein OIV83_004969 [Microbotryomycetes sp. JL201]